MFADQDDSIVQQGYSNFLRRCEENELGKINGFVKNVLEPRNIMMCFDNTCWEPGAEKRKILADIKLACKEWHVQEVVMKNVEEMDWKNRLLLLLLKHNQTELAYCLNSKILKKRFH